VKIPLGRPIYIRQDNTKIDLQEIKYVMIWTGFIWLRIGTSGGIL